MEFSLRDRIYFRVCWVLRRDVLKRKIITATVDCIRMKNRTAVMFIAAFFIISGGLAYVVDEAEAAPGTVVITGELYDGDTPIKNAEVFIKWNINDELKDTWYGSGVKTNPAGKFTVRLSLDTALSEIQGSPLQVMCITKNFVRISQVINDKNIEEKSEGFNIDLGRVDEFPVKYMETESITVDVFVMHGNVGISDARVSVKSVGETGTGSVKVETTDENGRCKFELKVGEYSITVERGGFEDWVSAEPLVLGKEAQVPKNIELVISPVKTYWGFDLPHLFTVMGVFTALVMTSLVFLYMLWINKHPGLTKVIDDSQDFDYEDDED